MADTQLCPKCGAPCDCIEVDIGVGIQRSPWHCTECEWSEDDDIDISDIPEVDEEWFKKLS
jgi:hypothetical protein